MKNGKKLILPFHEGFLKEITEREDLITKKSLLVVNSDSKLKDFLELVDQSLNTIVQFYQEYPRPTEDELTIFFLGCRVFNSVCSTIKLGLSGYYQSAFSSFRDVLETGFLLDYFIHFPEKIDHWRKAENKVRKDQYGPGIIRSELDDKDGFKERKRGKIYQKFCEYSAHPSYPGFVLLSKNKQIQIGPFFDETFLQKLIEELFLRTPLVTLYYLLNLKNLPDNLIKTKLEFLKKL